MDWGLGHYEHTAAQLLPAARAVVEQASRAVLALLGQVASLRERTVAALAAGNEDPDAFRATSRYVIATARRE